MKAFLKDKLLPILPTILSFIGVGLFFLPSLQLDSGFGDTLFLNSAKMIFGGNDVINVASGAYEFDYGVNVYMLTSLIISFLGGVSLYLGKQNPRSYLMGASLLLIGFIACFFWPLFLTMVNRAIKLNGLIYSFGFYLGQFFFASSIALSLLFFFTKKK